jgi:Family of unknown function (DUF5824)
MKIPIRYLPKQLTKRDKKAQIKNLQRSRKNYKHGMYVDRPKLASFGSKPSSHVVNAQRTYGVKTVAPSKELAKATGCTIHTLKEIVRKGEGAYYSSGSRPNQTAQSWGLARLASAITAGKSAAVDFDILERGCHPKKRAFQLALRAKRKYGDGHRRTRKIQGTCGAIA